mgnify:CR=1 FL=1|jgi:ABC-type uncharacterized transport system permease subunit
MDINATILAVIARVTAPILLCASGGIYSELSGAPNITLEGAMLFASFTGVVGSYYFNSSIAGILFGVLGGVLVNAFFGFLHLKLEGDATVTAFAINTLCLGMTTFLLRSIFHTSGTLIDSRIVGLKPFSIPLLKNIPVLGQLFTSQPFTIYFSWIFIAFTYMLIYKTQFGMNIRACGENPSAASSVGIQVMRIRWICVLITGVLCGLAGVQLSLGYLTMFSENMTAGRGFIAIAAILLAKGKPLGVLAASVLFGISETFSNQVQLLNISSYIVLMIPYLAVVIILLLQPEQLNELRLRLMSMHSNRHSTNKSD